MIGRRSVLAGAVAAAAMPVWAQVLTYTIKPERLADGLWVVRGADDAVGPASGGAIANISILGTPAGTVLVDCGPSLRYGTELKKVAEALTGKPIVRVYMTHLHPDHIYGAGAFDPAIVAATPALAKLLETEGKGFADGMYRLLGDWMRGTEFVPPGHILDKDFEDFGGRRLDLLALSGHSPADLAIMDAATGTLIAGDLVFYNRAPSTPHADLPHWRTSLDRLKAVPHKSVVPGHGPVDPTPAAAIDQTRDWIDWLDASLTQSVSLGLDAVEAANVAIPPRFAALKQARYELERSVTHLYARKEEDMLPRIDGRMG